MVQEKLKRNKIKVMKKFTLSGKMTITVHTTIKAKSIEEAIKLADERTDYMSLSSNNGDSEDEVWMAEELDGTPYEIHED